MEPLGPPVLVLASYVPASCHLKRRKQRIKEGGFTSTSASPWTKPREVREREREGVRKAEHDRSAVAAGD